MKRVAVVVANTHILASLVRVDVMSFQFMMSPPTFILVGLLHRIVYTRMQSGEGVRRIGSASLRGLCCDVVHVHQIILV